MGFPFEKFAKVKFVFKRSFVYASNTAHRCIKPHYPAITIRRYTMNNMHATCALNNVHDVYSTPTSEIPKIWIPQMIVGLSMPLGRQRWTVCIYCYMALWAFSYCIRNFKLFFNIWAFISVILRVCMVYIVHIFNSNANSSVQRIK